MELKEGYKQTEVGAIPSDWEFHLIGELIKFQGGSQPARDIFVFAEKKGYIRLLQIRDYKTDKYATYIPIHLARRFCDKEDIMIGRYGPPIFQIFQGMDGAYNVALIKAVPSTKLVDSYAYHYLKQQKIFQFVEKLSQRSSGQTGVDLKELKGYPLPLPPTKAEQTAIATALSDADALIQSLEKLIAKKRNIKQGAMQELLKPKEGWGVITFGNAFDFLSTASYSRNVLNEGSEMGYVHYGDIHTQWTNFLDFRKDNLPSIDNSQAKTYPLLKEGDLIMADASEDYEGIGKSVEVKNLGPRKAISGLHTILLRDKHGIFINGFRGYISLCRTVKKQLDRLATGLKVYGISKNNLKIIEIPLPSKAEQTHIATILSDMDAEIAALETKLAKYKQVKQGMMQELLTGRTRLV